MRPAVDQPLASAVAICPAPRKPIATGNVRPPDIAERPERGQGKQHYMTVAVARGRMWRGREKRIRITRRSTSTTWSRGFVAMAIQAVLYFDHEKLDVYQEATSFVGWLSPILEALNKAGDVKD